MTVSGTSRAAEENSTPRQASAEGGPAEAALFVLPRPSTAWRTAPAVYVTAAGWATAAERILGRAWVVTPDGVHTPAGVLHFPALQPQPADPGSPPARVGATSSPRLVAKDLLLAARARRFSRRDWAAGPWRDSRVRFVWQHHDLFATCGYHAARRLGCPLVLYVHAPLVWEAARWGVHRPRPWHWLAERFGDASALRRADLVACVSQEVAEKVEALGVSSARIQVSPMAVDAQQLSPRDDRADVLAALGIDREALVVGWVGSFRGFHGLDLLFPVFRSFVANHPRAHLLLVGDGPLRRSLEEETQGSGLARHVTFAGYRHPTELPGLISAFDVALVLAGQPQEFHYSPLKLREYMACARAVIAPRAGEIPGLLEDGRHALLTAPGNAPELATALRRLASDPGLRRALGESARAHALATSTWEIRVRDSLDAIAPGANRETA